jgi:hypothetical protein
LIKKVNRLLAPQGWTLETCLEEALSEWLKQRQQDDETPHDF